MIEELKKEIELNFGKKINTRGDCEELSEIIYQNTHKDINYNTLRRLFGLAKSTTPRKYTLDLLSIYVGFESYNDFIKRYNTIDDWRDWENIFDYLDNQSTDDIIELLSRERRKGRDFNNILITVCRELIIRKNYKGFKKLICQDWLAFKNREYNHIIRLGNSVGTLLRKENIPADVQISFLQSANYRDSIYKIYIDYSSFNGGYGFQVDYIFENLNQFDQETQIFTTALKVLKDIFIEGIEEGRKSLDLLPQKISTLHPILQGRIFALRLSFAKNNEILHRKLLREFEEMILKTPNKISEYLYEVMNAAFYFNDFVIFEFIYNLTQNKLINPLHWYHNYHYTMMRLVIVYYHLHCNDIPKAKQLLINFKPQSFRGSFKRFHGMYFHIANYHVTSDKKEKADYLESFTKIANVAKIKFINNEYLLNYFSPKFNSPYRQD